MKILSVLFFAAGFAISGCSAAEADVPVYDYQVVNTYPHDDDAYTQGLIFLDGYLYESTGLRTFSSLRKVELETGTVVRRESLPDEYFGEGIVQWQDQIIGLTWQAETGFVFGLNDFDVKKTFSYTGEGWGLTRDDAHIYMSDGTAEIRIIDPTSLMETDRFTVTFNGKPVRNLNELEWVAGEIFANIYQTDLIARINPASGKVTGVIDLSALLPSEDIRPRHTNVLNGIAYDAKSDRLFVTGKNWPKLFEIKLVQRKIDP